MRHEVAGRGTEDDQRIVHARTVEYLPARVVRRVRALVAGLDPQPIGIVAPHDQPPQPVIAELDRISMGVMAEEAAHCIPVRRQLRAVTGIAFRLLQVAVPVVSIIAPVSQLARRAGVAPQPCHPVTHTRCVSAVLQQIVHGRVAIQVRHRTLRVDPAA